MDNSSKFTNSLGRNYLNALFFETTGEDKGTVVYTLKRRDHLGYPSLHRLYLETKDPTEYRFAVAHLNGWSHWQELTRCAWFKEYLAEWRDELDVLLRSEAVARIMEVAATPENNNSYHANKYLLETLQKPSEAAKRGRPVKDTSKEDLAALTASKAQINDDAERLGLN